MSKRKITEDESSASLNEGIKKAKLSRHHMTIEIKDLYHFRKAMDALLKQKQHVTFYVVNKPPVYVGLEISTMNDGNVCMTEARFACSIEIHNSSSPVCQSFSLNIKQLQSTLSTFITSNYTVLWRVEDDVIQCEMLNQQDLRTASSITTRSSSSSSSTVASNSTAVITNTAQTAASGSSSFHTRGATINIPLVVVDAEVLFVPQNPEFEYRLPFEQTTLRSNLLLLLSLDITNVSFILYKPSSNSSHSNNSNELIFALYGENSASQNAHFYYYVISTHQSLQIKEQENNHPNLQYRFPLYSKNLIDISSSHLLPPQPLQSSISNLISSSSSLPTASLPDFESMEKIYEESFSIKFIEPFIKEMDHNEMTFYFSSGLPLIVHFQMRNPLIVAAASSSSSTSMMPTIPQLIEQQEPYYHTCYLRYYIASLQ
jgi:hypothetical protein